MGNKIYKDKIGQGISRTLSTDAVELTDVVSLGQVENLIGNVNASTSFNPFIVKFSVVAGDVVELPIGAGFSYDFKVDWGDGSAVSRITDGLSTAKSHTYVNTGIYSVSISGKINSYNWLNFGNTTGRSKLVEIVQWGDVEWKDISFYNCTALTTIPLLEVPNFLGVTTLIRLFSDCPITTVSAELLKLARNVTDFALAFTRTQITVIPVDFLKECQAAVRFNSFFKSSPVNTIPSGLFSGSVNAKSFLAAFRECPINSIPEDIFTSCILAEDFGGVFFQDVGTTTLTSIPAKLFKYNKRANNFFEAFRYAIAINTAVPKFWLDFPYAAAGSCFANASNIPNLSQIPEAWGGNIGVSMPTRIPIETKAYWDISLQKPVWIRDDGLFVDATGALV